VTASTRFIRVDQCDAIGRIWLEDEPAFNALSPEMASELRDALAAMERTSRAIVLSGSGRAFSAGAKLSEQMIPQGPDHDAGLLLETDYHPLIMQMARLQVPVVVGVNGIAAGGGMALALSGDIIVASSKARFVPAFSGIGLVPDCGVSAVLMNTVGRARASELLMLGDTLSADQAAELGLINRIVEPGSLEDEVMAIAARLAEGPTRALALTKRLLWDAMGSDLSSALPRERAGQRDAGRTADHAEGVRAFLDKRPPAFAGR